MVGVAGAPLLSDAQTGPGGLGIAGGRWACQVAARPSTAHVNPTSGSPGKPSTPPPKGPATLALPSNHAGGFATIDPRHAGDTPQGSAYGSNSPQATNEDEPQHHDKWTRMSNTTHATTPPATTPPQTSATASPTETPPAPPSQTPQHHTETQPRPNRRPLHPKHPMSPAYHRGRLHFEQPPGGFATIDPSTGTRPWPIQATTRGVLRP